MPDNEDFKTCVNCNQSLYLYDNFYIKRRHKNDAVRYDSKCKVCRKKKNDEYRAKNRENIRAKQREWDRNNAEKIATTRKQRKMRYSTEELMAFRSRQDKANYKLRDKRIVEYMEEHGKPPNCDCGCGEPVGFNYKGKPNQFVNSHQNRGRKFDRAESAARMDLVPLNKFREFVRNYRAKHSLTNAEVAMKGGWDPLYLDDVLYNKKRKYGLDKVEVDHFLRRLHGMAAPPTKWQMKQFEISNRRWRSTEPT